MNAHALADRPVPLRPDRDAIHASAMRSLSRAALAIAMGHLERGVSVDRIAKNSWPNDREVPLLLKAASPPLTLSDALTYNVIAKAFLTNLVPVSAAAAVLARGIQVSLAGVPAVSFPGMTFPAIGWIGEGAPFPVLQGTSAAGVQLAPAKIGCITSLTGEMIRSSNAEAIVQTAMLNAAAASLDGFLFDSNAAVAELRPAGLLHAITPITATTGGGVAAMAGDLKALAGALAPVAGNGEIVLIAAAGQAVMLGLQPRMPVTVLTSAAVPPGTVIGLVPNALVASVETPDISASRDAISHMDTAPLPIVAGATASPVYSMFQMDSVSLRLRWPVSWVLRDPRGIAVITGATW
jgi:hypothetical protein